ncbi:MAG: hypothetical protein KF787_09130 [Phycisphaeraceae bacterium]|nr:hypothetical protein [Phycisphaerae bacterium]MBX3392796.1 hypothetical protein [Phycisphaeraceae bacterium]
MPFFDDHWVYREDKNNPQNSTLARVGRPALTVPCPGGLLSHSPAHAGRSALDTVMEEMGFDPEKTSDSPSCVTYADRESRRLQPLVKIGFPYPPTSIRYEAVRRHVDAWSNGPPNDPALTNFVH